MKNKHIKAFIFVINNYDNPPPDQLYLPGIISILLRSNHE